MQLADNSVVDANDLIVGVADIGADDIVDVNTDDEFVDARINGENDAVGRNSDDVCRAPGNNRWN